MKQDEIAAQKETIRHSLILMRDLLEPAIVLANSQHILERLMKFEPLQFLLDGRPKNPVGLYAAFRGEPDIRLLTPCLLERGAVVAFPAIIGTASDKKLRFGVYDPQDSLDTFLQPGLFGVPEPPESSLLPFGHAMSALIVPGVAFDEQGGRLGFGKGYYDEMISALPYRPLLIGVAHPFQLQDKPLPMTSTDQRMDYLVLPDRTIMIQ